MAIDYTFATFSLTEVSMPKFVIEREIPGAGKMSPEELQRRSEERRVGKECRL